VSVREADIAGARDSLKQRLVGKKKKRERPPNQSGKKGTGKKKKDMGSVVGNGTATGKATKLSAPERGRRRGEYRGGPYRRVR